MSKACERCSTTEDIAVRVLWHHDFLRVTLCDDCNGYVQGPDHLDLDTGNRP